jgi:1L-myo-inositol 1-phosphate cytidylyltransferase
VTAIDTAVLLAAGEGSRLRPSAPFKPLCRVAGATLIEHAIAGLATAGIARVVVVTGYGADEVESYLAGGEWPLRVEVVRTTDWHLPNGVSALAAAPLVGGASAVLAMCDHLVDPAIYARLAMTGARRGLVLGVDRRLGHPWVDPDDVTCVQTLSGRIVAIGKRLVPHDAYDTGIFAVGPPFLAALASLPAPSITDGVRLLAKAGAASVVDCTGLDWIDVDDATALAYAEAAASEARFLRSEGANR